MAYFEYIFIAIAAYFWLSRSSRHKKLIIESAESKGWTSIAVKVTPASIFGVNRYRVTYIDKDLQPQEASAQVSWPSVIEWNENRYLG